MSGLRTSVVASAHGLSGIAASHESCIRRQAALGSVGSVSQDIDEARNVRHDVERALSEACVPFYIFSPTMNADAASAMIKTILPGLGASFLPDSPRLKVGPISDVALAIAKRAPIDAKLHIFAHDPIVDSSSDWNQGGRWITHSATSAKGLADFSEFMIWGLLMNGVMDGAIDTAMGKTSLGAYLK
eukprot:CAMPEP_0180554766 /NCGR_PEP_ID=MMETSP1036_2-20121128/75083_1 /TAXON_ID=632150 /ORGANISM="Azadinium spinosum, Strain 3D9" /LENGTH=186 /DNA_ID=CAMNT_0022570567 /DNA_START=12 /DNA_END=573 /DNA_ORIENTATION=+